MLAQSEEWQKLADQATANTNLQANPVIHEPDRGDLLRAGWQLMTHLGHPQLEFTD